MVITRRCEWFFIFAIPTIGNRTGLVPKTTTAVVTSEHPLTRTPPTYAALKNGPVGTVYVIIATTSTVVSVHRHLSGTPAGITSMSSTHKRKADSGGIAILIYTNQVQQVPDGMLSTAARQDSKGNLPISQEMPDCGLVNLEYSV